MNKNPSLSNYTWISIFIISIFSLYISSHTRISWDTSWLLEAANRFVEGGSYSHNFLEPNPPLIIYIYSLAILLSPVFGSNVFSLFFLNYSIALISILMSYSLLKKICRINSSLLNSLLITLCFTELILPGIDFGQREDLCLMLIMPYLLICSLRLENQNLKPFFLLACGLMAGIGFSIKPHFTIPLALIVAWMLYKKRNWKLCLFTENLSILGVMFCYTLAALFFNFDYFQNILPMVFQYYLDYWKSPWQILVSDPITFCVLFTLLTGLIQINLTKTYRPLTQILMLANLGFLIVFLIQSQVWFYHILPCLILSLLLVTLNLTLMIQAIFSNHRFLALHSLNLIGGLLCGIYIIVISATLTLRNINQALDEHDPINQLLNKFKSLPDGPFMVIATRMEPNASLLSYSERPSSSQAPALWLLPSSLKSQTQADTKNQALAKSGFELTRKMVIEDFQKDPPSIVVIDFRIKKTYLTYRTFDYLAFLKQDPRFRAIWTHYRFESQLAGFSIYVRND